MIKSGIYRSQVLLENGKDWYMREVTVDSILRAGPSAESRWLPVGRKEAVTDRDSSDIFVTVAFKS